MPVLAHRPNYRFSERSEEEKGILEKLVIVNDQPKPLNLTRPDKFLIPHPLVSGLTTKHLPLSYCHSPGTVSS
jgi:hypothetical protein